jgi:hypothetical protein
MQRIDEHTVELTVGEQIASALFDDHLDTGLGIAAAVAATRADFETYVAVALERGQGHVALLLAIGDESFWEYLGQ